MVVKPIHESCRTRGLSRPGPLVVGAAQGRLGEGVREVSRCILDYLVSSGLGL